MVAPGMLQNPSVRNWLGGIVPAWTLLDLDMRSSMRSAIATIPSFRSLLNLRGSR